MLNAEKVLQCTAKSGPNNLPLFKSLLLPGGAGARASAKSVASSQGAPRVVLLHLKPGQRHGVRPQPQGGA